MGEWGGLDHLLKPRCTAMREATWHLGRPCLNSVAGGKITGLIRKQNRIFECTSPSGNSEKVRHAPYKAISFSYCESTQLANKNWDRIKQETLTSGRKTIFQTWNLWVEQGISRDWIRHSLAVKGTFIDPIAFLRHENVRASFDSCCVAS